MGGETQSNESGLTVDTLKILMDERDKRYDERWQAQEKAAENLKEYQNEFRGALDDLSTKQATKVELGTAVKTLADKIDLNAAQLSEFRTRLDVGSPDIRTLQQQLATRTGQTLGSDKIIAYLVTGISVLFGLVGIVIGLTK